MAFDLLALVKDAKTIGITGHLNPDGDCIGSTFAMALFLEKAVPGAKVEVFLEKPEKAFDHIPYRDRLITDFPERDAFDVFIVCDTNYERISDSKKYFDAAKRTINIDHHISNAEGTGEYNYVIPEASACAEIITSLIPDTMLDATIAQLLYMGIAHDTGVFHFSNTSPQTMRTCARLLEYDFDFAKLLDDTFYTRTNLQNMMMGHALMHSRFYLDGRVIVASADLALMAELGTGRDETGGIVERLRVTEGVDCSVYFYEKTPGHFKGSLRSSSDAVNVAKVCEAFGGGGHARAAGCEYDGTIAEFEEKIIAEIAKQYS
ncbi:MAG: bifunctional oligoribonuclease/PAP phosphatase NrnA [Lachnospiraceae bacterium]|nr:bifunctional oligoribonuclease/PAP phosphatase NrnA [Lachnospiraceae bacterium]